MLMGAQLKCSQAKPAGGCVQVSTLIIPEAFSVSNEDASEKRLLQLHWANLFTPSSYFGISSRWIFWFHWWRLCESAIWCMTLTPSPSYSVCWLTGWAVDRMTLRRSCGTVSLAQSTGRTSTTRRWEQDLAARRHRHFNRNRFSVSEVFWYQGYRIFQKKSGWHVKSKMEWKGQNITSSLFHLNTITQSDKYHQVVLYIFVCCFFLNLSFHNNVSTQASHVCIGDTDNNMVWSFKLILFPSSSVFTFGPGNCIPLKFAFFVRLMKKHNTLCSLVIISLY